MNSASRSAHEPIPHRKVIRGWLKPVSGRETLRPLGLALLDFTLWAAAVTATVWLQNPALKLAIGIVAGFLIGRLFILGHDACHQSLTPHRQLNRWLGRILFLPSLTPYSLWDMGHNVVHHGYTNLKGVDFVWAPLSPAEYRALPAWRRWLERIYRSGWGPGLYYLIEIWWLRMFFPSRRHVGARRRSFTLDCVLVSAAALCWIGALWLAALQTGQSVLLTLFAGFVLPFLVWNGMIGWVVYLHHTHPHVAWYDDKIAWARGQPFVTTTVHLEFPRRRFGIDYGALLHHIMEHTAHHVDMTIPLYRLKPAQDILESRMPGRIVRQPFSWKHYFETAHRCKLYDCATQQWLDFSGRPTTATQAR